MVSPLPERLKDGGCNFEIASSAFRAASIDKAETIRKMNELQQHKQSEQTMQL
jgi:hypothetical protein